jgi:hypothetical protein
MMKQTKKNTAVCKLKNSKSKSLRKAAIVLKQQQQLYFENDYSGMVHRVVSYKLTDVSEVLTASIIREDYTVQHPRRKSLHTRRHENLKSQLSFGSQWSP